MYAFDNPALTGTRFLVDVLLDRVADYAAASHAGHGINSYGLNFHLVHDRLAILMQVGWGGHLRDNAARADELAGYWARVSELLDTPPRPPTAVWCGSYLACLLAGHRGAERLKSASVCQALP